MMATHLPYRATTATGERFDISFPLHPNTASPVRVSQMVSAILEATPEKRSANPGKLGHRGVTLGMLLMNFSHVRNRLLQSGTAVEVRIRWLP